MFRNFVSSLLQKKQSGNDDCNHSPESVESIPKSSTGSSEYAINHSPDISTVDAVTTNHNTGRISGEIDSMYTTQPTSIPPFAAPLPYKTSSYMNCPIYYSNEKQFNYNSTY